MPNVPPHTPLRRISHGSLYALSRSQSRAAGADPDSSAYDPSAPSALAFLGPALAQLADEAEVLAENAARQYAAADALRRFNEGFAAYLYATQMNMFGAYFPQAPIPETYDLAKEREEEEERNRADAEAARIAAKEEAARAAAAQAEAAAANEKTAFTDAEASYADTTFTASKSATSTGTAGTKKRGGKRVLSAKEKKERTATIERAIMQLPLAFRGSDPSLRRQMETVIEKLLDNSSRGLKLLELTAPPELNEARVRKCVLALTAAKVVRTERGEAGTGGAGAVLYRWVGLPDAR